MDQVHLPAEINAFLNGVGGLARVTLQPPIGGRPDALCDALATHVCRVAAPDVARVLQLYRERYRESMVGLSPDCPPGARCRLAACNRRCKRPAW